MRLIDADALYFAQRYARVDPDSDRMTTVLAVDKYQIKQAPTIDAVPVVHGRWVVHGGSDDAYYHHKCTNCDADAPFDYKYREDWDEGMDGEWYFLGIIDDGINEHLTPYCPNCGARMDGDGNG